MSRVQESFEAYVEMVLQAMVNYVDGDERVDRMWIYTNMLNGVIGTTPFFRFDGAFVSSSKLATIDSSREYNPRDIMLALDRTVTSEFLSACKAAGTVPERVITEFEPAAGSVRSSWDYEGVLSGPDDNSGTAMDRWIVSMGGQPIYG